MSDSILRSQETIAKTSGFIAKEVSKCLVDELFDYSDGKLFWKKRKANCIHIGDEAGCLWTRPDGVAHWIIKINDMRFKRSRIVWIKHYGDIIPGIEIDHADRNTLNDRLENLRLATRSQNTTNRRIQKNNTSGMRGVRFYKPSSKWLARISLNGKTLHLGYFDTKEDAYSAYLDAANKLHGHWNPLTQSGN